MNELTNERTKQRAGNYVTIQRNFEQASKLTNERSTLEDMVTECNTSCQPRGKGIISN